MDARTAHACKDEKKENMLGQKRKKVRWTKKVT
jgi:hypothetical protein